MWRADPDIPYRGARTYLHGTDLYSASAALVAEATDGDVTALDIRFPRFTRNAGTFYLVEGAGDREKIAKSTVRIQASAKGSIFHGWYHDSEQPASTRTDNFEQQIVETTEIVGATAFYRGDFAPPPIEIIVFMTKKLLQTLFPAREGKWVFTALRSESLLYDVDEVEIFLTTGNEAKASCSVVIRGGKFGDIYFGRAIG